MSPERSRASTAGNKDGDLDGTHCTPLMHDSATMECVAWCSALATLRHCPYCACRACDFVRPTVHHPQMGGDASQPKHAQHEHAMDHSNRLTNRLLLGGGDTDGPALPPQCMLVGAGHVECAGSVMHEPDCTAHGVDNLCCMPLLDERFRQLLAYKAARPFTTLSFKCGGIFGGGDAPWARKLAVHMANVTFVSCTSISLRTQ